MRMRSLSLLLALIASVPAVAAESSPNWRVYTKADMFAYSEPVSIENFAKKFHGPFYGGDTAFTDDRVEIGVGWRGWRVGLIQRFDYVTRFSPDTALVHYADQNHITLPQDREYSLMLNVEKIYAKGLTVGYTWHALPNLSIDVDGAYFNNISDLQSGTATAVGDLTPITPELISQAQAVIDSLSSTNKDLSPLYGLVANVNADIAVSYAYDKPKLHEPEYHKPVIVGPPNPPISGVDFSKPSGKGYSFDFSIAWQVNQKLRLQFTALDFFNRFTWHNAPQTIASFNLNPTLVDAIGVAQDFVNGEIVKPNDLVDRHLFVNIFNANYTQKLPHRELLAGEYSLEHRVNLGIWKPNLSLLGSFYRTESRNFPRLGLALNDTLRFDYDFAGHALGVGYNSRYFFVHIMSDKFKFKDARTLDFAMGVNVGF